MHLGIKKMQVTENISIMKVVQQYFGIRILDSWIKTSLRNFWMLILTNI